MGFDKWCRNNKIVGLYGIDTRALTQRIREFGAPKALCTSKKWSPRFGAFYLVC